ncbi:MAG TPA: sigma-70 family RNA polymerase sigma factor [Thermomicrobiales bacterium]|jgi:RNA polymerase sigma-70 factor (ECF subfamily)|nr:sigma-70 family RNA polymerase sigma factor [Thermomicrobiales bacterium]
MDDDGRGRPPPGNDDDDDTTLARIAATDRRAFAQLYRRWAEAVYRYCYRRLGTREAAEDATSQTMIRALDGIAGFRGGSFPAWLFTIAHNVVAPTVRRPSHRLTGSLPDELAVVDPGPGPETLALASESSRQLYAALAVLTPEQRQVIDLRLADLTTVEIAQVTGRTTDAVKMLHYRAIRRLRDELRELEGDARDGSRKRSHA